MASLTGNKINITYDSLLKVIDNDGITTSLKQITDGVGLATPLYISTTDVKVGGDLEITGDLTVGGTTTYVNTDNVTIKDGLVQLANNNTADIIDIGLYGKYNDGAVKYAGLYRDATDGKFRLFDGLTTEPTTTVSGGSLSNLMIGGLQDYGQADFYLETFSARFIDGAANPNQYISLDTSPSLHSIGFIGTSSARMTVFGAYNLEFATNNSVAMYIDSSGNLNLKKDDLIFNNYGVFHKITNSGTDLIISADSGSNLADSTIQFKVDGSEKMRIDSTGDATITGGVTTNKGITIQSTTDARVSIKDTGGGASFLIIEAAATSQANIYLGDSADSNAGAIVYDNSDNSMSFRTNGFLERMRIDAAGNVGVGGIPDAKIKVFGDSAYTVTSSGRAAQGIHISATAGGSGLYGGAISFSAGGSGSSAIAAVQGSADSDVNGLAFFTHGSGTGSANATERMRIDANGNVLLNETTSFIGTNTSDAADNKSVMINGGGAASDSRGAYVWVKGNEHSDAGVLQLNAGNVSGAHIKLHTGGTERMRIDSSGRVGIGENNPDREVDVKNATDNCIMSLVSGTTNISGLVLGDTADDDRGGILYNNSGDYLYFLSNAAERMRIDSGGNLLVGKQSTGNSGAGVNIYKDATDGGRAYFTRENNTNTQFHQAFFTNSGTAVGSISTTTTSTAFNTSSDYRLKEDWQPMADALTRIDALKPINFVWKADGSRVDGFLAHELQEVIPEAVTGTKDEMEEYEETPAEVDADGNIITEAVIGTRPKYQGIDQSKIVPLLVAAIQELKAEVEALKGA